jgi:predicted CXXCH cytochrome family protein
MMKGASMNGRYGLVLFCVLAFALLPAARSHAQDKFKLKPGATGKICLNCHVLFQDKLKNPSVHTPVKSGNCADCHNPHTSTHGKLLDKDPAAICSKCHSMIPEKAVSTHKIVAEQNCTFCHDTHAALYKYNLSKDGNELCFSCHPVIEDSVKKAKFKHPPVGKGCLSCHTPHASAKSGSLLKNEVPALCVSCHKTDTPTFAKRHMNYPVAKARCTSCHNVHGSSTAGILYDTVHKPVLTKMCNQCHEEPTSSNPLQTKKEGFELCRSCHSKMINETMGKKRLHWPVVSGQGCLSCHTPHASAQNGLLKGQKIQVCGACHEDTIARQERALDKHNPVREGNCNACHMPHSSDSTFLLRMPIIEQCGTCHDYQRHSTHPVGEKTRDPRNKNLDVQCLSCHSAHGTAYKHMMLFETASEMCTQCHAEQRR